MLFCRLPRPQVLYCMRPSTLDFVDTQTKQVPRWWVQELNTLCHHSHKLVVRLHSSCSALGKIFTPVENIFFLNFRQFLQASTFVQWNMHVLLFFYLPVINKTGGQSGFYYFLIVLGILLVAGAVFLGVVLYMKYKNKIRMM